MKHAVAGLANSRAFFSFGDCSIAVGERARKSNDAAQAQV